MNIGIPKERRPFEFRVGMTPVGVQMLTKQGHMVYVEHDAGQAAGFSDLEYEQAGARIAYTSHEVFGRADLLLKVARPVYEELEWLRPGVAIMGILHLGSSRHDKIDLMVSKGITAIPYEQIRNENGELPLRKPLSQICGNVAAYISARLLQSNAGGKGILIGGMTSVPPAEVVMIGAGVFGTAAVRAYMGMGAHVTVLDTNMEALQRLYDRFPGLVTMPAYPHNIARTCTFADVLLGAILVPGQTPPIVVTREMVRTMKPRSVVMDISIDEGGCIETSRLTSHEKPTFIEEGIIHYAVPNIPSTVARTATHAFMNVAFPYIIEVANKGVDQAVKDNGDIARGVAVLHGDVVNLPQVYGHKEEGE
jgi:alanine dehydrogenase